MFSEVALQQMPEKLQQLCKILQHASEVIESEYTAYQQGEQFEIQHKSDASPVTQADLKSHVIISAALDNLTPKLPILSEEGQHDGREHWQQFWMIDPLDGTKEFIHKTGEFSINLSLIEAGESVISALAIPLKHAIYICEKGQLPFKWQWQNHSSEDLNIYRYQHQKSTVQNQVLRIAMSRRPERHPKYQEFLDYLDAQNIAVERIAAGSAYKFCMMLEDTIDLYPRFHPTSEWDTSAGQGLLQSIGGEVFDLNHQPFQYNQRDSLLNGSFIAVKRQQDWQYVSDFLQN